MRSKLREMIPENPRAAVTYMMSKVVKAVGDAKLLGVRLRNVRHQESLSYLAVNNAGAVGFACAHKIIEAIRSMPTLRS